MKCLSPVPYQRFNYFKLLQSPIPPKPSIIPYSPPPKEPEIRTTLEPLSETHLINAILPKINIPSRNTQFYNKDLQGLSTQQRTTRNTSTFEEFINKEAEKPHYYNISTISTHHNPHKIIHQKQREYMKKVNDWKKETNSPITKYTLRRLQYEFETKVHHSLESNKLKRIFQVNKAKMIRLQKDKESRYKNHIEFATNTIQHINKQTANICNKTIKKYDTEIRRINEKQLY